MIFETLRPDLPSLPYNVSGASLEAYRQSRFFSPCVLHLVFCCHLETITIRKGATMIVEESKDSIFEGPNIKESRDNGDRNQFILHLLMYTPP